MIVSCQADVGGALVTSAMYAVQMSFFEVARMRAEPRLRGPQPRGKPASPKAEAQPKVAVAPGPTLSDVATGSLLGEPPAEEKLSTPTCIVAASVEVQEKNVVNPAPLITPGTE